MSPSRTTRLECPVSQIPTDFRQLLSVFARHKGPSEHHWLRVVFNSQMPSSRDRGDFRVAFATHHTSIDPDAPHACRMAAAANSPHSKHQMSDRNGVTSSRYGMSPQRITVASLSTAGVPRDVRRPAILDPPPQSGLVDLAGGQRHDRGRGFGRIRGETDAIDAQEDHHCRATRQRLASELAYARPG